MGNSSPLPEPIIEKEENLIDLSFGLKKEEKKKFQNIMLVVLVTLALSIILLVACMMAAKRIRLNKLQRSLRRTRHY